MILFPILVLVLVLALLAQVWLVASGTLWSIVRHRRGARYHPAFRLVVAVTLVETAAVLLLGLVLVADR